MQAMAAQNETPAQCHWNTYLRRLPAVEPPLITWTDFQRISSEMQNEPLTLTLPQMIVIFQASFSGVQA